MPTDRDCFLATCPTVESCGLRCHQYQICRVAVKGSEVGNVIYLASVWRLKELLSLNFQQRDYIPKDSEPDLKAQTIK